jgi:hypothetical protein
MTIALKNFTKKEPPEVEEIDDADLESYHPDDDDHDLNLSNNLFSIRDNALYLG